MAARCQVAKAKLARFTAAQAGPSSLPERVGTMTRAGLLGTMSVAKGFVGNTGMMLEGLASQPAQAGMDYILSIGKAGLKSAQTGKLVSPEEFRTVINGTNRAGFEAMKRGWSKGTSGLHTAFKEGKREFKASKLDALGNNTPFTKRISRAIQEAKEHITGDEHIYIADFSSTRFKSPISQALADAAFMFVEAVDRPAYYAAEEMSRVMQSRLAAIKAGYRGDELNVQAERIRKLALPDIEAQAGLDAHYATLKDRGALATTAEVVKRTANSLATKKLEGTAAERAAIQAIRHGGAALEVGTALATPFTGVPTSFAAKMLAYGPQGLLALVPDMSTSIKAKILKEAPPQTMGQARHAQIIAKALIGTAGIAYGWQLMAEGNIRAKLTPSEREDHPERKDYEVKIGGVWYDSQALPPVFAPLFAGAVMYADAKKNPQKSMPELVGVGARSALMQAGNSSMVQGIRTVADAITDPNRTASSVAAGLVPVPSMFTQAARAIDPQPREANTFLEKMANRLPFTTKLLDPALSSTGVVAPRTSGQRLQSVISPIKTRDDTPNAAWDELDRLGVNIGKPGKTMQQGNKKVELTYEQRRDIVTEQGRLILPMVERALKDQKYLAKTDEDKTDYWERIVRAQKARAKITVRKQFNDTASGFFTGARR